MGWLELIPMLKRLLPLLSRVAPMLETFVAVRAANGKDTEEALERLKREVQGEFTTVAAGHHAELQRTMVAQNEHLRVLTEDMRQLHLASGVHDTRMEAVEAQVAAMAHSMRTFALVTILLLVLCATLLLAIFLRH